MTDPCPGCGQDRAVDRKPGPEDALAALTYLVATRFGGSVRLRTEEMADSVGELALSFEADPLDGKAVDLVVRAKFAPRTRRLA